MAHLIVSRCSNSRSRPTNNSFVDPLRSPKTYEALEGGRTTAETTKFGRTDFGLFEAFADKADHIVRTTKFSQKLPQFGVKFRRAGWVFGGNRRFAVPDRKFDGLEKHAKCSGSPEATRVFRDQRHACFASAPLQNGASVAHGFAFRDPVQPVVLLEAVQGVSLHGVSFEEVDSEPRLWAANPDH